MSSTSNVIAPITDQYTYLDYKESFSNLRRTHIRGNPNGGLLAPGWVGIEHNRRMRAYVIYEDYYRNASRRWLNPDVDVQDRLDRREYGDAYVITEMLLSSLMGNQVKIFVEENDDDKEIPDPTDPLANAQPDSPQSKYLDKLNEWAEKEKLFRRMAEVERNAIKLGDGVYVLGWSEKAKRPKLKIYNPGFYFPVLDEDTLDDNGWPTKVHIAYEFTKHVDGEIQLFLRRITWHLREDLEQPVKYKWNDKPSKWACYMTDATWAMTSISDGPVQDMSIKNAVIREDFLDKNLGIDFLPVVHIPNWVSEEEHFGISTLGPLAQILDDIQAADTDLSLSAATTGSPPIAVHNAILEKDDEGRMRSYGPRTVLETGEGGATLLDTSRSLDALLKYSEHLGDALSEKSRLPKTLLGRVDPSKVPSGIVMTLSFSPHSGLVRTMRLIREEKYQLMLDFIGKMFWGAGEIDAMFEANIKFGSYLPADKTEVMNLVVQGLTAHTISMDTAVLMLIEAGFPIDDSKQEIAKIVMENFDAAGKLVDATGDINAGRSRLGLPDQKVLPLMGGGFNPDGTPIDPTKPIPAPGGVPAPPVPPKPPAPPVPPKK